MDFKRLIEARVEEVRAKRRLEAEQRREALAMSPNTRSASGSFKKVELAMIDAKLIALTPNVKVEEGVKNPTMRQTTSKQTILAPVEHLSKPEPKSATAPKYAGLKASRKRKLNGTSLNRFISRVTSNLSLRRI
jgi:hypothetical protein